MKLLTALLILISLQGFARDTSFVTKNEDTITIAGSDTTVRFGKYWKPINVRFLPQGSPQPMMPINDKIPTFTTEDWFWDGFVRRKRK